MAGCYAIAAQLPRSRAGMRARAQPAVARDLAFVERGAVLADFEQVAQPRVYWNDVHLYWLNQRAVVRVALP